MSRANVTANVTGSAHSPLAAGVRGRDLISYLSIADLLRQTGFGAARAPHPMCAEAPQTSARGDLHSVRCTIPPGGLGPVTGPILTPATPKAPDTAGARAGRAERAGSRLTADTRQRQ